MRRVMVLGLNLLALIAVGVGLEWVLLTGSSPQAVLAALQGPTPTPILERPTFQTGVVFARWGLTAYGKQDTNWYTGLAEIHDQTAARWLEITVDLYQPILSVPQMVVNQLAPTPASLEQGVRTARAAGYHVFVVPLITVGGNGWAGQIRYKSAQDQSAWFASYWQAWEPYVAAAARGGADQLAIGTEMEWMQRAPDELWNQLIDEAHSVFPGTLTYDMNYSSLGRRVPLWMYNPYLTYIGVSEYRSLVTHPARVDPAQMIALWHEHILSDLDTLSIQLGKPVLLSEIGYRNASDTFYRPWMPVTQAPADPEEQAAAYNAALSNVIGDPHIAGIYFWSWSMIGFQPNWLPAAHVLHAWYTSPRA
jgi:hypothetical protein